VLDRDVHMTLACGENDGATSYDDQVSAHFFYNDLLRSLPQRQPADLG
jgi:hypothetical protein